MRRPTVGRFSILLTAGIVMSCSEVDPEEALTRRTVGLAYLEENRLQEAEAEFLRLVQLAPAEPLGHANLGVTYLRLARYQEAEEAIQDALALNPSDPDVQLILATILGHAGRLDDQKVVLESLVTDHPTHIKGLFTLSDWFRTEDPDNGSPRRIELLSTVVSLAESNLPARLQLIDLLLAAGLADSARAHAEAVEQQLPELPAEASQPFQAALESMRNGESVEAAGYMRIAHNALRVTQLYSAGILDVVGPGGPSVGFPVLTFSQDLTGRIEDSDAVFAALQMTDATELAGADGLNDARPTSIATGDYDGDGDQDLLVGTASGAHLFDNEFGQFTASEIVTGAASSVALADIDNDGWLDAVVGDDGGVRIAYGSEGGTFVTTSPGLSLDDVVSITIFDFDQDGDLDLIGSSLVSSRAWQNNLDGTFTDRTSASGLAGTSARGFELGDFDDDGDVDLIGFDGTTAYVFDNRREGRFEPTEVSVLPGEVASVTVGDYTNDGWLDLFVLYSGGGALLRNRRDGSFEREADQGLAAVLSEAGGQVAAFADIDNDGRLDLITAGNAASRPGVLVHRNDGTSFNVRDDLETLATPVEHLALLDYNEDGDIDVVAVGPQGVRLLRNDGGNGNRYLNVQLVGLRAGSGKNNHFGIGAKVEVRAGDLYQTRVVTSGSTHFGLGQRVKADAVRIQWTNGVPQNLFYPGSDQDVVEEQTLKGSCAFLYTWNGEEFTFVTDIVWRSALGMPMGIMGGSASYAPAYPSQEYIRIPSGNLVARGGQYQIQVTEELWEVAYLDELTLLAIDHPDSVDIFVDERFVPPGPGTTFNPFQAGKRFPLAQATDDRGNDVTDRLSEHDFVYVDNFVTGPHQGVTRPHDLILDLGQQAQTYNNIVLYLAGWLFPSDASINVSVGQSERVQSIAPILQVRDDSGNWITVEPNLSFPSGKNKTTVVDLTGLFPAADRTVRIRTNMEVYWDYVFFTRGSAETDLRVTRIAVAAADLHYRGFSRMYRKGGRNGPHWFDYSDVVEEDPWGPVMEGNYTRYGDVTDLLHSPDDRYVIMAVGDEVTVSFPADLPAVPVGWSRNFILYSDGWIKDADMNTATGNLVAPLPFRALDVYPYTRPLFVQDEARRVYNEQYNTRRVTVR